MPTVIQREPSKEQHRFLKHKEPKAASRHRNPTGPGGWVADFADVHESVILSTSAEVDCDAMIRAGCIVDSKSYVGIAAKIYERVRICSGCVIESFAKIFRDVQLSVNVTVETQALVRQQTVLHPHVHVGAAAEVGEKSIVLPYVRIPKGVVLDPGVRWAASPYVFSSNSYDLDERLLPYICGPGAIRFYGERYTFEHVESRDFAIEIDKRLRTWKFARGYIPMAVVACRWVVEGAHRGIYYQGDFNRQGGPVNDREGT